MTGPLPKPSSTGVRVGGDDYQWLHAWTGCLRMHLDADRPGENPIVGIGVETRDGNVDDVVYYRRSPPNTYSQVKYAVDSSTPLNTAYLTARSAAGGPSILTKAARSLTALAADGAPVDLALVTNRLPDPTDVLLGCRDARTQLLMPRAGDGGPRSAMGAARAAWSAASGLDDADLRRLLSALRFDYGHDLSRAFDTAGLLMMTAGLRGDATAVRAGVDWVAQQVKDGHRRLDPPAVAAAIDELGLRTGPPWAAVSIATLATDPLAADALWSLDWVDRFDGDNPFARRRPAAPATWRELQAELEHLADVAVGHPRVAITGSLRQATAFTAGAALRMASGTDVAVAQRGVLWPSTAPYTAPASPEVTIHEVEQGTDLAVSVEIATAITDDVLAYIRTERLPVNRLVVLRPAGGPKDNAVPDASAANALAVGLRDATRKAARTVERVHLFLAGPMALSLLLGNRWNRIARNTIVYEDLAALGYEPAFTVSG